MDIGCLINISGVNVSTLAGNVNGGFVDGSGTEAEFDRPYGVAVDAGGNVYVADTGNERIRKITVNTNRDLRG
jgi:DNA-binding beta-propeller fold protein YncE